MSLASDSSLSPLTHPERCWLLKVGLTLSASPVIGNRELVRALPKLCLAQIWLNHLLVWGAQWLTYESGGNMGESQNNAKLKLSATPLVCHCPSHLPNHHAVLCLLSSLPGSCLKLPVSVQMSLLTAMGRVSQSCPVARLCGTVPY